MVGADTKDACDPAAIPVEPNLMGVVGVTSVLVPLGNNVSAKTIR